MVTGTISNQTALPYLISLSENGRTGTAEDAGTNSVYMRRMEKEGLLKEIGPIQSGQPGRPSVAFRLTDKAVKRVQRATCK